MKLELCEIGRYLGYGTAALPPEVAEYAAQCERELERTAAPRTTGRRLSLSLLRGESRDLDRHLRHCEEGFLAAVTLGSETDRLLRRWSALSMAKAAVGQAVCAVWLDDLLSDYCTALLRELPKGSYLTPPYSPGYGDWSLAAQRRVLDALDAYKKIGLTLTAGGMLVPEKSITCVVGISDRKEDACGQKCMRCRKTDCPFRAAPDERSIME